MAFDVEFQVESYLRYQGEQFSRNFDANTYLIMTKALDYFDPSREYEQSLKTAMSKTKCQFLSWCHLQRTGVLPLLVRKKL